jgi:hypothetical protein
MTDFPSSPETEILPCPFCGSKPVTERTGFSLRAMYIYCINDNGCPRPKAIGETEEKAIENWNLRFGHAQTPVVTSALALADRIELAKVALITEGRDDDGEYESTDHLEQDDRYLIARALRAFRLVDDL